MWLAPEVLTGFDTTLTRQVDVYAFGILCAEVLNKGAPPWGSTTSPELLHDLVCRECPCAHHSRTLAIIGCIYRSTQKAESACDVFRVIATPSL